MFTTKKNNKLIIVKKLKDYSDDPVFVKRAQEAAEFLKKCPIPEDMLKGIPEELLKDLPEEPLKKDA